MLKERRGDRGKMESLMVIGDHWGCLNLKGMDNIHLRHLQDKLFLRPVPLGQNLGLGVISLIVQSLRDTTRVHVLEGVQHVSIEVERVISSESVHSWPWDLVKGPFTHLMLRLRWHLLSKVLLHPCGGSGVGRGLGGNEGRGLERGAKRGQGRRGQQALGRGATIVYALTR